jgi:hypothetical protein
LPWGSPEWKEPLRQQRSAGFASMGSVLSLMLV